MSSSIQPKSLQVDKVSMEIHLTWVISIVKMLQSSRWNIH